MFNCKTPNFPPFFHSSSVTATGAPVAPVAPVAAAVAAAPPAAPAGGLLDLDLDFTAAWSESANME